MTEAMDRLGDLPSRLMGWVGKARRDGQDPIYLDLETVDRIIAALAASEARQAEQAARLQIGDKVRVVGKYETDWRGIDTWIAGIQVSNDGDGLSVTLAEQWPVPARSDPKYRGLTDGFRLEELVRTTLEDQHG